MAPAHVFVFKVLFTRDEVTVNGRTVRKMRLFDVM